MPAIGITGGIATGKSSFSESLRRKLPALHFDADRCAHDLLAHDAGVQSALRAAFGDESFDAQGKPDRVRLREIVFGDPLKRQKLEQILHPAIRASWIAQARQAAQGHRWFCADIPLLYETDAQPHFAAVIVIACSPATQRARLLERRHLPADTADKIMAAQLALTTKIAFADYVVWNDSAMSSLDRQARLLAGALQQRFHHG